MNPAVPGEVLGTAACGGRAEAEAAVAAARAALPGWRDAGRASARPCSSGPPSSCADEAMELAALMTLEAGKPRARPTPTSDEAIDFLEYYGREMLRLGGHRAGSAPCRERTTHYFYEPRGVALVIAPWNFPLAILTGMTSAALVAGNPVIVKPAGPTPLIAAQTGAPAARRRRAARARSTTCPAPGPRWATSWSATRGSTSSPSPGPWRSACASSPRRPSTPAAEGIKQVIAEMGGKNAIIVDADADLDVAVPEVGRLGLPLRRPEVLGGLPGDRPRGGLRELRRAPGRGHAQPRRGPARKTRPRASAR